MHTRDRLRQRRRRTGPVEGRRYPTPCRWRRRGGLGPGLDVDAGRGTGQKDRRPGNERGGRAGAAAVGVPAWRPGVTASTIYTAAAAPTPLHCAST